MNDEKEWDRNHPMDRFGNYLYCSSSSDFYNDYNEDFDLDDFDFDEY
jgi:hypothetical protein